MSASALAVSHTETGAARDVPDEAVRVGIRLARSTLVNVAVLVAGSLAALFPLAVARLLGAEALGTYALAWAGADLLSKIGTFGLDQSTVAVVARLHARGDGRAVRAVFTRALVTGVGLSALVAAVGWAALAVGAPRIGASRLLLLALPAVALYRVSNGVSRGLGIMGHDIFSGGLAENAGALAALGALVAAGAASRLGAGGVAVLAAAAGCVARGLVAFTLAARAVSRVAPGATRGHATGLLRYSAPIAGASLLNLLLVRLDVIVLGCLVGWTPGLGAVTVGVYCAAVEVAGVTRKIRQAIEAPFLHAVATAAGTGTDAAAVKAQGGRWVLATLLLVGGTLAVAGPLVLSLFGPAFVTGEGWLLLLLAAQALNSYSGLAENVLLVRRPGLNLLNAVLVVPVYGGLALALGVRHGATGTALAAVLAFALLAVLRFAELRTLLGAGWPWARMRGTVLAFALTFLPAFALASTVGGGAGSAAGAAVFAFGYVGAWWRLGREPADVQLARAALRVRTSPETKE